MGICFSKPYKHVTLDDIPSEYSEEFKEEILEKLKEVNLTPEEIKTAIKK
tara:strand:- start:659 stop:808 length:150 start_codon:yes stop_codon:yes gene_type:complete